MRTALWIMIKTKSSKLEVRYVRTQSKTHYDAHGPRTSIHGEEETDQQKKKKCRSISLITGQETRPGFTAHGSIGRSRQGHRHRPSISPWRGRRTRTTDSRRRRRRRRRGGGQEEAARLERGGWRGGQAKAADEAEEGGAGEALHPLRGC